MDKIINLNFKIHISIISKKIKQGKLLSINVIKKSLQIGLNYAYKLSKTFKDTIYIKIDEQIEFVFEGTCQIQNSKIGVFEIDEHQSNQFYEFITVIRKYEHIYICSQLPLFNPYASTFFELFNFIPKTLPQVTVQDLSLKVNIFNSTFDYPILIAPMIGGIPLAHKLNLILAKIAYKYNIPMGIGSQKLALLNSKYNQFYEIKKIYPNIFLIANIGFNILQSKHFLQDCIKIIDYIKADALSLHINVMQEFVQYEGHKEFYFELDKIQQLVNKLPVPLIIKEVGCGIDIATFEKLIQAGVKYVDISGKGGTSWNYIEMLRTSFKENTQILQNVAKWGIPTALNLFALKDILKNQNICLIASGGIRDGMMISKAIALGASTVGIALPFLQAALQGEHAIEHLIESYIFGIKATMIGSGCQTLSQLQYVLRVGEIYQDLLHINNTYINNH